MPNQVGHYAYSCGNSSGITPDSLLIYPREMDKTKFQYKSNLLKEIAPIEIIFSCSFYKRGK